MAGTNQEEVLAMHPNGSGPVVKRQSEIREKHVDTSAVIDPQPLKRAVKMRLRDDYSSVYLFVSPDIVAVTDHETPADPADAESMERDGVDAFRTKVVDPAPESSHALFARDMLEVALAELDEDRPVEVHIGGDAPVWFEQDEQIVAVAPQVRSRVTQR